MAVRHLLLVATLTLLAGTSAPSAQTSPTDYTQWRGTNRDGSASSFSAPSSWPETLTQRWKVEVGLGYATPLIVGNRIYVFARQGDNESMSALDLATGKQIWQTGYPARFEMQKAAARHEAGPKSTPVFAAGKLFSIGMTGIVTAFDAATGKQLWQKPGSDIVPMYTTHSFSPVVDGGLVYFHVGGHNQGALTAFEINTGKPRWSWNGDGPGYGSPIVVTLDGTRQVIALTQGKLVGLDALEGTLLWERPFVSANFTNSATPVLHDHTLILSNGGPVVAVTVARRNNQWAVEDAWQNPDVPFRLSNAIVIGDVLYGFSTRNMGQYFAVDVKSGKTLWTSEPRQGSNAALVKAGDIWFSLEDDGELVVARASRTAFELIRRYQIAESATWTQPTISGNRILVKDVSSLALWTLN